MSGVKYERNNTKIYRTNNSENIKNRFYSLKTTVDTATEYVDGVLRLLTPDEWNKRKKEYGE